MSVSRLGNSGSGAVTVALVDASAVVAVLEPKSHASNAMLEQSAKPTGYQPNERVIGMAKLTDL